MKIKKHIIILLLLVLILPLVSCKEKSDTTYKYVYLDYIPNYEPYEMDGDEIKSYSVIANKANIGSDYDRDKKIPIYYEYKLDIPETYNGKPVVCIDAEDERFSSLYELIIPKTIIRINCPQNIDKNINKIVVDSDNKVYDSRNNCNAVIKTDTSKLIIGGNKSFIPSGVKIIGNSAFCGSYLNNIIIPESVEIIEESAFASAGLVRISFPKKSIIIGDYAFFGCKKLAGTLDLSYISNFGKGAFSETGIDKIMLNEHMTKIEHSAFSHCINLKQIKWPKKLEIIGQGAFSGCQSLQTVKLPKTVKKLETSAFTSCFGLKSIELSENLIEIKSHAFFQCKHLESIFIPQNVSVIESNVFNNCYSLESIVVDSNNSVYTSNNGSNVIVEKATNKLIEGCSNSQIYEGITIIGEGSFNSRRNYKKIELPSTVKVIENRAFMGCNNVESITLNDGLEIIEEFSMPTRLTDSHSIFIPVSMKKIYSLPYLLTIYYEGTQEQWNQIDKSEDVAKQYVLFNQKRVEDE